MDDLTIIIVSWNCKRDLEGCLRSINDSGTRSTYSIVVVDNNSADGTVGMLAKQFPSVQVIANAENVGFAAANNQALARVQSRYAMLLNPDTLMHAGTLDALITFMNGQTGASAAGPRLLNRDGSSQLIGMRLPNTWDILCESLFLDRVFPRSRLFGHHKELYLDQSVPRSVDYVPGACLIVSTGLLKTVGGLDERFFMYFEEVDWCWRMKKAGGAVLFCPLGTVMHLAGGGAGHYDERRLVYYHKSLMMFYRKHYSRVQTMLLSLVLAFRSIIRLVVWTGVWLLSPERRASASSTIKGYARTLGLVLSGAAS